MARKPKTRADGEGSIYEEGGEGSGRWCARLVINGKVVRRRAKTKGEAKDKLKELHAIKARGLQVGKGSQTLRTWCDHWLTVIAENEGLKPNTIAGHRANLDRYVLPTLGDTALNALTKTHVQNWLKKLRTTPKHQQRKKGEPAPTGDAPVELLAPSTIATALRRLKTALGHAVADKVIAENVAEGVSVGRATRKAPAPGAPQPVKALDIPQVAQLLDSLAEHRLYALFALAATLGMRQAEIIGLRWPALTLDGDNPQVHVREQLQRIKDPETKKKRIHRETVKGSNDKDRARVLPLSAELASILRAHKALQLRERLILGDSGPWQGEDLVFTTEIGTPLNASNLLRLFKGALRRAGLPVVTFHSLRHSAGSIMLALGAQIVDVSEVLGHGSPMITARIYAHSFQQGRRSAVELASGALFRKGA